MLLSLETERLILRKPNASDVDAAVAFFTSDRAAGVGGPLTPGKAWRALAGEIGHWDMRGYGMWTVTRKGEDRALAMIGPWFPNDWPEQEIGWMVWDPAVEGTGIATEAARAAIDDAFGRLGWPTAVSYVGIGNTRSARLAEKLGAVLDKDAAMPDGKECWVYRHPKPENAA